MEHLAVHRAQLESELSRITQELTLIAIFDSETGDWIIRTDDLDQTETDENNQADASEEADERTSILALLENQYRLLVHALKKFELKTYGVCEISGEPIEEKRLLVNPAARTCTHHMENESALPLS
jgi:RNA polymerase-binding transcription factor DksA